MYPEAHATTYMVSNESECLAFPGTTSWGLTQTSLFTCFLTSDFTLNSGDILIVENIEFRVSSFTNFGTINLNGGSGFGEGRLLVASGGNFVNECGGTVNANGGTGIQSGNLSMFSDTATITNFDTINLNGGSGPVSGSIVWGTSQVILNNHGIINQNLGTGVLSGTFANFSGGAFNDDLPPKCEGLNTLPDCSDVAPSVDYLWPANNKMTDVSILGVTDPDGDDLTIAITGITQDEPIAENVDGDGVGTDTAQVRAERDGNGDGRVYEISFSADDGNGGMCTGSVNVKVPHDQSGNVAVDGGQNYNSLGGLPLDDTPGI